MYTTQKENDTTHLPKKVMKQLLENYYLSMFHLLSNLDGIMEESCELQVTENPLNNFGGRPGISSILFCGLFKHRKLTSLLNHEQVLWTFF